MQDVLKHTVLMADLPTFGRRSRCDVHGWLVREKTVLLILRGNPQEIPEDTLDTRKDILYIGAIQMGESLAFKGSLKKKYS